MEGFSNVYSYLFCLGQLAMVAISFGVFLKLLKILPFGIWALIPMTWRGLIILVLRFDIHVKWSKLNRLTHSDI